MLRNIFCSLVLFWVLACCGGCLVVGAVLHKVFGPPAVAAKYAPPKEPTLVLVESKGNPSGGEFDADQVARSVGDELKKHEVGPLIDPDKLASVRETDPDKFRGMSIVALGRAVGAKKVIYVDLVESGVDADASEGSMHASATARVRVVDVESGDTVWPLDTARQGYELDAQVPYSSHTDRQTVIAMHNAIITNISDQIAKLFYAWKPETEQESNNG